MSFVERSAFCLHCEQRRLFRRQTPNHVLHFLITLFSCFLWFIPWLILSMFPGPWRCSQCGVVMGRLPKEAEPERPAEPVRPAAVEGVKIKCPRCGSVKVVAALGEAKAAVCDWCQDQTWA